MDPKSDVGQRSRYLVLAPGFSLNKKTKTGHFALSNKIYHHSQFLSDKLRTLNCDVTQNLNTIGACWYFWKGSWTSKAHKPVTLS